MPSWVSVVIHGEVQCNPKHITNLKWSTPYMRGDRRDSYLLSLLGFASGPFRRNVDSPSLFLQANTPSDARKASDSASRWKHSHIFVKEVWDENISGRPLKLILQVRQARIWPNSSIRCYPPKRKKEPSFWDGADLWTFGPGPTDIEQNSMDNSVFMLPYRFFLCYSTPSLHTFGSSHLPTCLNLMVLTNWVIIAYLPARLSWSPAWQTSCYHS